ncbi:MAG: hypothetical protein NVSMB46_04700 [Candidatus Saccharimonadales bacterium]
MSKLIIDQNGFGVIGIVLILVIAVVVGFTSWFVLATAWIYMGYFLVRSDNGSLSIYLPRIHK